MRSALTVPAVCVLVLSLGACAGAGSGGSSGDGTLVDGKTFTMALGADPGSLDPHRTSLSVAMQTNRFLYDSLVNIDPKGEMVAGLAEKWDATTTKATFTLRKGVTCSDGSPLTAGDVAANINFVADPDVKKTGIGAYVNVPPGSKARADDATGEITVTSPVPDAFLARNVGGLLIVCKKGLADRNSLKQEAHGTGMFTLSDAVPGNHYTLTRRKDYAWGPGDWDKAQKGLPDKVVLKVVKNETTAANLLLSKQVNLTSLTGSDKKRVKRQHLFQRDLLNPLGELWFNQKSGMPTADPRVRRALTQALNLEQLAKVLGGGDGQTPTGMVSPGGPCKADTVRGNLPAYDTAAAKAALDAAGWKPGDGGVRAKGGKKLAVALYYPVALGTTFRSAAELTQQVWSDLGAEVTLRGVTDTEAGTAIIGGQGAWTAGFLPIGVNLPSELPRFLSGPNPPKGGNFANIQNPGYAAGVQKASTIAGEEGCPQWEAAEKALIRNVDVVPFATVPTPMFAADARFELTGNLVTPSSIRMVD